MKIKSVIAAVAASALTLSALSVTAFAEKTITNANENGNYTTNVKELDYTKIVGIKATITAADGWNETGLGGCLAFNADSKGAGWKQFEWGINGDGTDAKNTPGMTVEGSDGKFTLTYKGTDAYFVDTDEWDGLAVAAWWGADFSVDSLIGLDADGNEVGAKPADETPAETTTTAEAKDDSSTTTKKDDDKKTTTTKSGDSKKDGATKTGDAGVGVVVAGLSLAGAAAFIARKKH